MNSKMKAEAERMERRFYTKKMLRRHGDYIFRETKEKKIRNINKN